MLTESQMIRLIEETEARIAMTEIKAKNKAIFASNLFFMTCILKMPFVKNMNNVFDIRLKIKILGHV